VFLDEILLFFTSCISRNGNELNTLQFAYLVFLVDDVITAPVWIHRQGKLYIL